MKSVIAEIKVSYKAEIDLSKQPQVKRSLDSYLLFRENWDPELIEYVEQFKILLLTKSHRVLGVLPISTGGISSTVVDPKVIFGAALKANACALILAHNHPSGNIQPSRDDIELTKKLVEGGNLLDVAVLDHLIISPIVYLSMADKGLM